MQIAGIELGEVGQSLPIADLQQASLKIHHPRRGKFLQRTVHAGDGHPKGTSHWQDLLTPCWPDTARYQGRIAAGSIARCSGIEFLQHRIADMFLFFSNRMGCLGSLLFSAIVTVALLFMFGLLRF